MTYARHMNANLVGTAGLKLAFDISVIPESLQNPVMRDSASAVWCFCAHFLPVCRITSDRRVHCTCIFFQIAEDNGVIPACNMMFFELVCKDLMGPVILADEERTCRVHIDPVDNPRAENTVNSGKAAAAVIENRIYQRMAVMPGRRVYDHSLRLIYNKDVLILIQDVQRDFFGKDVQWLRIRDLYTYLIPCIYFVIGFDGISIYQDTALFYELLDLRTGKVLKIFT